MKISGFTFLRNAGKLYYPVKESILSILPVVDEFVIALGRGDADDNSREILLSIDSDKIRIVDTEWDTEKYPGGTEYAHQTDIAKAHCTGDWLFYLQSDELVHEKYHDEIRQKCSEYLIRKEVEALVFNYRHFWGDYDHYRDGHTWYRREIRIIRNDPDIHSWEDAQSFRRIPDFNDIDYRQKEGSYRLKAVLLDAWIYHYGWVRPPSMIRTKLTTMKSHYQDRRGVETSKLDSQPGLLFDYGPLNRLPVFTDSHPAVLKDWIARFDWKDQLRYSGGLSTNRPRHKQDRLKYRILSFIEKHLLFGGRLGEFKNYVLLKK